MVLGPGNCVLHIIKFLHLQILAQSVNASSRKLSLATQVDQIPKFLQYHISPFIPVPIKVTHF